MTAITTTTTKNNNKEQPQQEEQPTRQNKSTFSSRALAPGQTHTTVPLRASATAQRLCKPLQRDSQTLTGAPFPETRQEPTASTVPVDVVGSRQDGERRQGRRKLKHCNPRKQQAGKAAKAQQKSTAEKTTRQTKRQQQKPEEPDTSQRNLCRSMRQRNQGRAD